MNLISLFALIITIFAKKKSPNEIPIVKTASKNYYLELRIDGYDSPRTLFYMDFNSTQSYIDASMFPHLQAKKNHTLQVLTPRQNDLGYMNFTVLPTNISWVQYKGIIGLGLNSNFILMLEKTFNKPIGLRAELISGSMVIEKHPCRNPQVGPFKVSMTTWTTVNYMTPLSLNFQPSQDFLSLLNKTQNNFNIALQSYHQDRMQVTCMDQQRSVKIKKFIDCWNIDSSDNYQCKLNISSTPDVGLAIFALPVKVCKDGVDIGISIISTQSYFNYFAIIIAVNLFGGLIFLNRKKFATCLADSDTNTQNAESLAEQ